MQIKHTPSFLTLLLMISFGSVNAVLFTPSLPAIATFFAVSKSTVQLTITWFLIGYAIGQLLYGPIANRWGRKPALYIGISLQIVSSLLCAFSAYTHSYALLVIGRLLLALGSGVGLKMTFTLVNEIYEHTVAAQKLSYLMIAFAITPGLGVALGGFLTAHFNWTSTFYAGAIYGVILLLLSSRLPETKKQGDINALKLNYLIQGYGAQFKNLQLITGGLLMGSATCFVYVFAALAPIMALTMMHMKVTLYGIANLLPSIGLILGSLLSAQLSKKHKTEFIIQWGISITFLGSILMLIFFGLKFDALIALFIPMMICYLGLSLILVNASMLAMRNITDKAHASAVLNFINIGLATGVVFSAGFFQVSIFLLPAVYIILCFFMLLLSLSLNNKKSDVK